MWLSTEDKKLINVDHVEFFELADTRIIANFPSITTGGEIREVNIMVKRYPNSEAAARAYNSLMAGMDDLLDIEEFSREATPTR